MKTCKAIAQDGRINLVINKKEAGYKAFAKVLTALEHNGFMSWYGDVEDENGVVRCGLIITPVPDINRKELEVNS